VHLVGFHYKNISWCTVLWMSNSSSKTCKHDLQESGHDTATWHICQVMSGQQQWPGDVSQQDIHPTWATKPPLQGNLYVPGKNVHSSLSNGSRYSPVSSTKNMKSFPVVQRGSLATVQGKAFPLCQYTLWFSALSA